MGNLSHIISSLEGLLFSSHGGLCQKLNYTYDVCVNRIKYVNISMLYKYLLEYICPKRQAPSSCQTVTVLQKTRPSPTFRQGSVWMVTCILHLSKHPPSGLWQRANRIPCHVLEVSSDSRLAWTLLCIKSLNVASLAIYIWPKFVNKSMFFLYLEHLTSDS